MKNLQDYLKESFLDNRPKTYKSIDDFRKRMPEKEIFKAFEFLELDTNNVRHIFNRDLFNGAIYDLIQDALGNGSNSYIESIKLKNNKVYFCIYVQGDSDDDIVDVSYDEFTKPYGDVAVKSNIAEETVIYTAELRLKILNNIQEFLSDFVDGQEVFL